MRLLLMTAMLALFGGYGTAAQAQQSGGGPITGLFTRMFPNTPEAQAIIRQRMLNAEYGAHWVRTDGGPINKAQEQATFAQCKGEGATTAPGNDVRKEVAII